MKIEGGLDVEHLRFVLLEHRLTAESGGETHWDLLLEQGDSLLSLQLAALPGRTRRDRPHEMLAKRLPNHRAIYLDYEGEISGNRGSVRCLARGFYSRNSDSGSKTRCGLTSAKLNADLEFEDCPVGQETRLWVRSWDLLTT